MNKEEKQLLVIDLCVRLPFDVDAQVFNKIEGESKPFVVNKPITFDDIDAFVKNDVVIDIKPYLRPMSSMTEEEFADLKRRFVFCESCRDENDVMDVVNRGKIEFCDAANVLNWLNERQFDYHGLINKGLAIDISKASYNLLKTNNFTTLDDDIINKIEDGMYDENGLKDLGDGIKMDREGHIIGGLKFN